MKNILLLASFIITFFGLQAQTVTITPNGITPAPSGSYLRISYDAILALPNPQQGDTAYDITFNCLRVYTGSKWICTYQNPGNFTPNVFAIASAGGPNNDFGFDIATDGNGDIYVTGSYVGTAIFGSTILTSVGSSYNMYIAKFNKNGALIWVKSAGGANTAFGLSIAIDSNQNPYITGSYVGTATFGNTSITSVGGSDVFIAKYNSNGTLQWIQSAGGTSDDAGQDIAIDAVGNIYVTGTYRGTATFGNNSLIAKGADDMFIVKYNNVNILEWAKSAGGLSADGGSEIAIDKTGNIYVTGHYAGTATFGELSLVSMGGRDIFIAKYNNSGVLQWLQSAGGTGLDFGSGIAIDDSDNLYVTGYFSNTATFSITSLTSKGLGDIFIAKYNNNGSLQWLQSAGGTFDDSGLGSAIDVDSTGNVFITGEFRGTANFGSASITSTADFGDIFVAHYNSSGNFQWVKSVGGMSGDNGRSISVDTSSNVYATGTYRDSVYFGSTLKTSAGYDDIFVIRLDK